MIELGVEKGVDKGKEAKTNHLDLENVSDNFLETPERERSSPFHSFGRGNSTSLLSRSIRQLFNPKDKDEDNEMSESADANEPDQVKKNKLIRLGSVKSELFHPKSCHTILSHFSRHIRDKYGRSLTLLIWFLCLFVIFLPFPTVQLYNIALFYFFLFGSLTSLLEILCHLSESLLMSILQLLDNTFLWPIWFHASSTRNYLAPLGRWSVLLGCWELILDRNRLTSGLQDKFITVSDLEIILTCLIIVQVVFLLRQLILNMMFWEVESKQYIDTIGQVEKSAGVLKTLCRKQELEGRVGKGIGVGMDSCSDMASSGIVSPGLDASGISGHSSHGGSGGMNIVGSGEEKEEREQRQEQLLREEKLVQLSRMQSTTMSRAEADKIVMDAVGTSKGQGQGHGKGHRIGQHEPEEEQGEGFFRLGSLFTWYSKDILLGPSNRLSTEEETRLFAQNLFSFLIGSFNKENQVLELDDFQRIFKDPQLAEEAFLEFVRNESQKQFSLTDFSEEERKISSATFQEAVLRMRTKRLELVSNLQSSGSASSVIAHLFNGLSWVVVPFIFASQFGASSSVIFFTSSTIIISLAFALGTVISHLVESIYFIFVTKPYKVGDIVMLGSTSAEGLVVLEIKMMSTKFRTFCNKVVIIPNHVVAAGPLINYNGLPNAAVKLSFRISADTEPETVSLLEEGIRGFLEDNVVHWRVSSLKVYYSAVNDLNAMEVSIWVTHRKSWQEGAIWTTSRSQLLNFVRNEMRRLNVTYFQPPVKVLVDPRATEKKHI